MIRVESDTVTGAVALATSFAPRDRVWVKQIDVHFGGAPTTSESLTITLNSALGADYDTLIYSTNPSLTSMTDLHQSEGGYQSPLPILLVYGDSLDIAFANTDANTIGVSIYYEV